MKFNYMCNNKICKSKNTKVIIHKCLCSTFRKEICNECKSTMVKYYNNDR